MTFKEGHQGLGNEVKKPKLNRCVKLNENLQLKEPIKMVENLTFGQNSEVPSNGEKFDVESKLRPYGQLR